MGKTCRKVSIDDLNPIKCIKHGSFNYKKEDKKLTYSDPSPNGGGCYLISLNDTIKYVGETANFERRINNYLTPGNRKTARRIHKILKKRLRKGAEITFVYIDGCEIAKMKISLMGKTVMADRKLLERYIIAYTRSNHL